MVQWRGSGVFIAKNSVATSWHKLLHQFGPFASSFVRQPNGPKCTKFVRNAPKHELRVQWSGLGAFVAKKSRRDFVARTFASMAPVHTVLHRVSCSYETMPNAPKHYATHQNMSLGSNVVDWVRSLWKILTWLCGTNFCINCSSSHHFAPSFMQLRNNNRWTQNTMKLTKTWV